MKNSFVASLDRELSILDQEMALLDKEMQHIRRRQDKVRKLRGLYTGVNVLRDELGEAEVEMTPTQEEMIARVKENAGRELTQEEIVEHVHRDFGFKVGNQPVLRASARGPMQ